MQNAKLYALLMISAVLMGTLCLYPAISSLMNWVTIANSGQISTYFPTITAASGYWRDIQDAINAVVATGVMGNVIIPEGTWNFVNVNEDWSGARVVVPAGINVSGAPTERTSGLPYDGVGQNPNDQVVEWRTVLVLPWNVPSNDNVGEKTWFYFTGNGKSSRPSRFSDIELVGYREIDASSTYYLQGLWIDDIVDFRVDHNYFRNVAGKAVMVTGLNARGVIDHSRLVNTNAIPAPYDTRTVDYGIYCSPDSSNTYWDTNISNIFGHYTNYSVFVEDNYLEKWRHCMCANHGSHYVFRHNTIQYDCGYGSVDCHGPNDVGEEGTRAVEIYNNKITEPIVWDPGWSDWAAMWLRSGAGLVFNNTVGGGYVYFVQFSYPEFSGEDTKYFPHPYWLWGNSYPNGITYISVGTTPAMQQNVDYFLHAPDTFSYTPYQYPHPLTLQVVP